MGTHPIFESDFDCLTDPDQINTPSPTTSASWTFQNSSFAPFVSPKLLVPASWPPAVKSSLSINWLSKHQRDKTPSFSKAQESKELLASISKKLQVDPAQEPSHLS